MPPAPGFVVAAPASAHGKTIVTLGLIRAFRQRGLAVSAFKVGPDYIDPAFQRAASGRICRNLDLWAMRRSSFESIRARVWQDADMVIGEGVMGLYDGAPDGSGSTADVAHALGLPIVLVLDVRAQGASAAAVVHGFCSFRSDIEVAGIILNRVGSPAHEATLRAACSDLGPLLLGAIPGLDDLVVPDRHLGLIQAAEHADLERFTARAADAMARYIDLDALRSLAQPPLPSAPPNGAALPVLGQRIALASDAAFAFAYPSVLEEWRAGGAELALFSPLAGEGPRADADAIYLPGGYPELYGGRLAANRAFIDGLGHAAERGIPIYGECGGYMVLGRGLIDGDGHRHPMAGLLPLETTFADRRRHLGYREVTLRQDGALGRAGVRFKGHEFHYASIVEEALESPLFACKDARGTDLGPIGSRIGSVFGSFVHLIDRAE